jgi:hypothetical protein
MVIQSTHCPVLGARVTQVTDLEGAVTRVICAEYNDSDCTCRLKGAARASGPLGQLLERMSEESLETRSLRCVLVAT